jgi:hypothetical protein
MKLRALTLALGLLLLGGGQAQGARSPVTYSPTLLWRTYPLVQDPFSPRYRIHAVASTAPFHSLPVEATPSGTGSGIESPTLLLLVVVSLGAAVLGLMIVRSAFAHAPSGWATARRSGPTEPEGPEPVDADMLVALKPEAAAKQPVEGEDILTALQPSRTEPDPKETEPSREITPTRRAEIPQGQQGERGARMTSPELRTRAETSVGKRVDTCRVMLWHGYLKSQLYAEWEAEDGSWQPSAVSDYFKLKDEDVPPTNALAALENLIAQLENDGWTVISEGPRWYEVELERRPDEPRATAE